MNIRKVPETITKDSEYLDCYDEGFKEGYRRGHYDGFYKFRENLVKFTYEKEGRYP